MLNSYSYSQGGHANANASNYLKINAITGTLVKNHPKSIFVTATTKSTLFDPTNPRYNFPKIDKQIVNKTIRQSHWNEDSRRWEDLHYKDTEMCDKEIPCVVLQSMIIGDELFLCEIVKAADFFVVENQNSNREE